MSSTEYFNELDFISLKKNSSWGRRWEVEMSRDKSTLVNYTNNKLFTCFSVILFYALQCIRFVWGEKRLHVFIIEISSHLQRFRPLMLKIHKHAHMQSAAESSIVKPHKHFCFPLFSQLNKRPIGCLSPWTHSS